MLRKSATFSFFLLIAVSAFGQSGTQWRTSNDVREGGRGILIGTVTDVDEGRRRFTVKPDDDQNGQVTVEADAVSTQYNGFGGTINGSPEIFVGSTGFSNLRVGDRVEVRGVGRNTAVIGAEYVTLLGRPVEASQTGVGQTRTPNTISPPTASGTTPSGTTAQQPGRIEGVVRQVNAADGRVVIETDRREMITVRGTSSTPVYYRNTVYRISNLEPGDRIRVEPEGPTNAGSEMRARTIDVLQSMQESGGSVAQVGALSGRVTSIDRRTNSVRVDNGRTEVRVDLTSAVDSSGRRVRAADMQVGDQVDMSGNFSGDTFTATTVRFGDDASGPAPATPPPAQTRPSGDLLGAVTIYGTVAQSVNNGPRLIVRDTQNNQTLSLYVLEDFVVRTKTGTYTTADRLKEGDAIVVKAYRDADGNYIAQTIRLR
jgi:preprotein translocase subunit YajC